MDIIFHVLEIEKKEGKTIFKTLINFTFEELYKYFITDDTVIINDHYIYDIRIPQFLAVRLYASIIQKHIRDEWSSRQDN